MKKLLAYFGFALLAFIFESCSLDEEPIGANIYPASEKFEFVSDVVVSVEDVDFSADSITLNASFNEEVSYTVTFTGLDSKATKIIEGVGTDISTASLVWNGEHDGLTFFRDGEKVKIEISVKGNDVTSVDTLSIVTSNPFNTENTFNFTEAGFEDLNKDNAYGKGWYVGLDEVTEDLTRIAVTTPVPPQGSKSFKLAGRNSASTYVTGIDFVYRSKNKFYKLPADADEVWFNIYVYGNGNANTKFNVEFAEADAEGVVDEDGLPDPYTRYKRGETDGVLASMSTAHEGWKLYSFQYSAIPFSTYAPGGGSGNKIHESDRIQAMLIGIETVDGSTGEYVEAIFDYPIFTIGGPFDPSIHKSKP